MYPFFSNIHLIGNMKDDDVDIREAMATSVSEALDLQVCCCHSKMPLLICAAC